MNLDRTRLLARVRPDRDWYRISNQTGDGGPAEVVIYDEIGWFGVSAEQFMGELRAVTAGEITLRLSSPGGSVFDGIAIMNALRSHPARVTVHVDALAASIASVIAMAGDRVVMQPHSQLMIHDALAGTVGNAEDLRELADLLDRQSDNIAAIYAERAGGTAEEWRAAMKRETWYSAEEAVEAGLADEVARPARQPDHDQDPAEALAASWDLSVFRFAGRAQAPDPTTGHEPTPEPEPEPVAEVAPATEGAGDGVPADAPEPTPDVPAPTPTAADDEPPAEPEPDPWATATAHLINPPSAADEWARLREALL